VLPLPEVAFEAQALDNLKSRDYRAREEGTMFADLPSENYAACLRERKGCRAPLKVCSDAKKTCLSHVTSPACFFEKVSEIDQRTAVEDLLRNH
jgi:hypothetical protein